MLERLRAPRSQFTVGDYRPRVERATELCQRLLLDLAQLGYGDDPELAYLPPAVAEVMRDVYARYHRAGWVIESDFGETATAAARVPDDDTTPVCLDVVVNDRSVLRRAAGERRVIPTMTWRMRLTLDAGCQRVMTVAMERG